MRSRLFHSIVGVAIAVVPSGCSEHELVARPVSVVADSAAPDTENEPDTSGDTNPLESDAADTALETEARDTQPETSADTSDAGSETFSDAPTDADASDGWAPTK